MNYYALLVHKYATKPQPTGTHQSPSNGKQQASKPTRHQHVHMSACIICMHACAHANMQICKYACMRTCSIHTCAHKRLGFTLILGLTEWDLCNPKIETLVGTGTNLYCKGQNNSLVCLLVKAQYLGTICIFIPNGNV